MNKTNQTIELGNHSSEDDVKKAIMYAYFEDKKPDKPEEYHAFKLLVKITKFNIAELTK